MKQRGSQPNNEPGAELSGERPAQPSAQETPDFRALYQEQKSKEIAKLSEEIEERRGRDTKKKRRNWWIKTVLMLLLIGVSIFIMFGINSFLGEGSKSFTEMIAGIDWGWFALLIGILLFGMIAESAKYAYLLKISTGKFRFRNSIKTMLLGKYYDGMTPFATGGQPFQIYYLHKKDIPAGAATSIPLARFIVSMIVWCLISVVILAVSPMFMQKVNGVTTTIQIIAWISVVVNLLIPLAVIFISFFPKAGKRFIVWLIGLLSKMHLVKHKYTTCRKYVYEVQEYCNSIKVLFTSWYKLLPLILFCIAESAVNAALPFFVVVAVAGPESVIPTAGLLMQIVCLNVIAQYSAYLVPTPGNTAAMETTTALVFATVGAAIDPVLGWVVLIWRFATYYVYILSGIGINIFEIIRGAVRNRRARKEQ